MQTTAANMLGEPVRAVRNLSAITPRLTSLTEQLYGTLQILRGTSNRLRGMMPENPPEPGAKHEPFSLAEEVHQKIDELFIVAGEINTYSNAIEEA